MLAATTCSSVVSPATLREKRLRRGSSASIDASLAVRAGAPSATQSPMAGNDVAPLGLMAQPAPHARQRLAVGRADAVDVLVLEHHAGGDRAIRIGREGVHECRPPPELDQPVRRHRP